MRYDDKQNAVGSNLSFVFKAIMSQPFNLQIIYQFPSRFSFGTNTPTLAMVIIVFKTTFSLGRGHNWTEVTIVILIKKLATFFG